MPFKNVPFTPDLYDRLKEEQKLSGINGNSIVILAVTEYLTKKEKERKK